jgi:hypothetical protein
MRAHIAIAWHLLVAAACSGDTKPAQVAIDAPEPIDAPAVSCVPGYPAHVQIQNVSITAQRQLTLDGQGTRCEQPHARDPQ